jgi:hypothetical protein
MALTMTPFVQVARDGISAMLQAVAIYLHIFCAHFSSWNVIAITSFAETQ